MSGNPQELFPLVDENGVVVGSATRQECHNGSKLLHPVVHLHLFNMRGELYLQKRAMHKDIQPGKWDTAVGGHVDYGESIEAALRREAREELGLTGFEPQFVQRYIFESAIEKELIHTFLTRCDATPVPDRDEVECGRFWSLAEIDAALGQGIFTPNFENEYRTVLLPRLRTAEP